MWFRSEYAAAIAALALVGGAQAGLIQPIFTNIDDHPTARIPGLEGGEFRFFAQNFEMNPRGDRWIFQASDRNSNFRSNEVVIAGMNANGGLVAQEGQPVTGIPTETLGEMSIDVGINDGGVHVFGTRLDRPNANDAAIIRGFVFINSIDFAEGSPAPGLLDPGNIVGDETLGDRLDSVHVLNDGRLAFRTSLIHNVGTDFWTALYLGDEVILQTGVPTNAGHTFDGVTAGTYATDQDGSSWLAKVDVDPTALVINNVTVNGTLPAPLGSTVGGFTSPVETVFDGTMGAGGDWFIWGDNVDQQDWVLSADGILAKTGGPILAGATERWADADEPNTFFLARANQAGDYIIGGATDAGDKVIVANNDVVVARTGDPIDLNENGVDDDFVVVGDFIGDNVFLGRRDYVYMMVDMQFPNGTSAGQGFLRVQANIPRVGDMNCDGVVSVGDINPFVLALTDPAGYLAAFPDCDPLNGDCSGDDQITVGDINCFVSLVTGE